MSSVSEDSLCTMARDIVSSFVNEGVPLNDGVRKCASEHGFNRDQTARLIERTNSEAFLRLYPDKTDFVVADPEAILNEKVASETSGKRMSYNDYLNRDLDDIFGISGVSKTASYETPSNTNTRGKLIDMVYTRRIEEEARVEKMAKLLEVEDAEAKFWEVCKLAAYNGKSIREMELELLYAFPNDAEKVACAMDTIEERLLTKHLSPSLLKRASVRDFEGVKRFDVVVPETELTLNFKAMVDILC